MVQAESMSLGCVCPECGYRCRACMGTNTMMDRDAVKSLKALHDADKAGSAAGEEAERAAKKAVLDMQLRMMESEEKLNRDKKADVP